MAENLMSNTHTVAFENLYSKGPYAHSTREHFENITSMYFDIGNLNFSFEKLLEAQITKERTLLDSFLKTIDMTEDQLVTGLITVGEQNGQNASRTVQTLYKDNAEYLQDIFFNNDSDVKYNELYKAIYRELPKHVKALETAQKNLKDGKFETSGGKFVIESTLKRTIRPLVYQAFSEIYQVPLDRIRALFAGTRASQELLVLAVKIATGENKKDAKEYFKNVFQPYVKKLSEEGFGKNKQLSQYIKGALVEVCSIDNIRDFGKQEVEKRLEKNQTWNIISTGTRQINNKTVKVDGLFIIDDKPTEGFSFKSFKKEKGHLKAIVETGTSLQDLFEKISTFPIQNNDKDKINQFKYLLVNNILFPDNSNNTTIEQYTMKIINQFAGAFLGLNFDEQIEEDYLINNGILYDGNLNICIPIYKILEYIDQNIINSPMSKGMMDAISIALKINSRGDGTSTNVINSKKQALNNDSTENIYYDDENLLNIGREVGNTILSSNSYEATIFLDKILQIGNKQQ